MSILHRWKPQPIEFLGIQHGYSLASGYYKQKTIEGIKNFKITDKGERKIREGMLIAECHNFLVYLKGSGARKTGCDDRL